MWPGEDEHQGTFYLHLGIPMAQQSPAQPGGPRLLHRAAPGTGSAGICWEDDGACRLAFYPEKPAGGPVGRRLGL